MVNKAILLIFDGLGDLPVKELGWKTPLEAAETPNFDKLATESVCGLMNALGRGIRPGSDTAHLGILGYDPSLYYTGRGPIEVAGLGVRLREGDVAFRGNFATVDEDGRIVDRRAGRITDVKSYADALDGIEIDGITFTVKAGTAHRAGVVMRGFGLSSHISDADPHVEGKSVCQVVPLDDSKEAAFTASVLNRFTARAHEILEEVPENVSREKVGKLPANHLLLRGAGSFPSMPSFSEKYGLKACCVAGGGLYKGIGAFLGMDVLEVDGATALPDSNINAKFARAKAALKEFDFVFVHVKAADSLAEDGNFMGKKEFIEKCDESMGSFLDLPDDVVLAVTADHSTASYHKAHSGDPVPIMIHSPYVRRDTVTAFNERSCVTGGLGRIAGCDVMPEILNVMGRLPLVGA